MRVLIFYLNVNKDSRCKFMPPIMLLTRVHKTKSGLCHLMHVRKGIEKVYIYIFREHFLVEVSKYLEILSNFRKRYV